MSKIKCFCWPENQFFVIIAFKMLKMEFKLEYTHKQRKCSPFWPVYVSEVKKILRKSQAGFREKVNLRLWQNDGVLVGNDVYSKH